MPTSLQPGSSYYLLVYNIIQPGMSLVCAPKIDTRNCSPSSTSFISTEENLSGPLSCSLQARQTSYVGTVDTHRAAMAALLDYMCSESHKHNKDNSIYTYHLCGQRMCRGSAVWSAVRDAIGLSLL